jgi:hypothetical protein
MRRMYEFTCTFGHTHEAYVDESLTTKTCPECGEVSPKIISSVRSNLCGWNMHFPTAADKWARVHEQATRQARERKAKHGDDAE